jgi:hypothetical protein
MRSVLCLSLLLALTACEMTPPENYAPGAGDADIALGLQLLQMSRQPAYVPPMRTTNCMALGSGAWSCTSY